MKREILFRGKHSNYDIWAIGSLISDKKGGYAMIQITDTPITNGRANGWCLSIDKETVGQYTGIKDIKGSLIFEGDIIQDNSNESCKHIIKWFDSECCFGVLYIGINGTLTPDGSISQRWIHEFDKIVIGNIHDNPELVKSEKK